MIDTLGDLLRALPSLGDGNELKVWIVNAAGVPHSVDCVEIGKTHIMIKALPSDDDLAEAR
jgi:hypothetical protein